MLRVDGRTADGRRDHRRSKRRHPPAQVCRQDLLELDECSHGGLLDPGHGGAGGRAEADRDGDRLLVAEQQRRHRGSGAEPVAAGGTRQRVHRVAEVAEPLDVSAERSARHRQPVGELGARPVAAGLEQREQPQESARGRGHDDFSVAEIEDRS
jgi:hypothetical protein